ncbi:MAG: hypothetical protein PVG32_20870, partial [Anaerolineales bacterium]
MKMQLRSFVQQILPRSVRRKIIKYTRWPPVGLVRFGGLRRIKPISSYWGSERGKPIDRYYIEQFLAENTQVIRGHVLEIGDDQYTRLFGGERVTKSDVLHVTERKTGVTIIADLTDADDAIPSDTFDCIILTQTLNAIYAVPAAIRT